MDIKSKNIQILDSTLRDGVQGQGISFSVADKIKIVQALDELGISLIEAGNPGSNPKDMEFFLEAQKLHLKTAKLCAFGSTRKKGIKCTEDSNLQSLLSAGTQTCVIFGKSWDTQVQNILHCTLEENLDMIAQTCSFLKQEGRGVIFDAEHFFDGYKENPTYAIKTLKAAKEGGATILNLCETQGASMPFEVYNITKEIVSIFGKTCSIGIHTHNDTGLAVANTLLAVQAGSTHVQGTLLGFGERTGNANLSCIIADLQLKMGFWCVPQANIKLLTPICKRVAEISNISLSADLPYIGSSAFSHKAGMHIDAVTKDPHSYEHICPETVGNVRAFLMSEVAGRSTIIDKIKKFDSAITKNSPIVSQITKTIKEKEHLGFQYEAAEASFELLVRKSMGKYKPFFTLHYYKTSGQLPRLDKTICAFAQIKLEVEGQTEVTAGEGDGPVNALDIALRKALQKFYPCVSTIRLTDYKVRVLDGKSATASTVRVLIESSDGVNSWTTVGVSSDIMEASWQALVDSFEYKLIKDMENKIKAFL